MRQVHIFICVLASLQCLLTMSHGQLTMLHVYSVYVLYVYMYITS